MEIEELRRLSAKEELSLNYIAKDEMISKILFNLQDFDDIILKGGTAINRIYIKNKRFSEDIDFDIISNGTVKEALAKTKENVLKLKDFFEIAKPRIMNKTIRYDLYYLNPLNHKDRIMLEFKPVNKVLNYSKKIINYGFVPFEATLLNVYELETLIAFKLECLLTRMEGKDLFDLYYLLDLIHKPIKLPKEKRDLIINRLQLNDEEVKAMANVINHYIPKNIRPNWGIFISELIEKIKQIS